MLKTSAIVLLALVVCTTGLATEVTANGLPAIQDWTWSEIQADAPWEARAGLRVVELRNKLYLLGGRTPIDPAISPAPGASTIWGDVWRSRDKGSSWTRILETDDGNHWPARAYFQAVTHRGRMWVIGGQNYIVIPNPSPEGPPFLSVSEFFNDVWSSRNGMNWTQKTADAGWEPRAGLSAVSMNGYLYVMGGSQNDDDSIIGGPPARIYFNDVWRSRNGRDWELVTEAAPWEPRAGAVVVVKNGWMYLFGGEDGFLCSGPEHCPPYYNDVWRSRNGSDWELVTAEAPWSARPGHQVVKIWNTFVLFGGFGLDPLNPFLPANPMDIWISRDGANWTELDSTPWNAAGPEDIKYDFAAIATRGGYFGLRPQILTFGGDRETFDFNDPNNWLNIDNDVWRYSLPWWGFDKDGQALLPDATVTGLHDAAPNPFNPSTTIAFSLAGQQQVRLRVFDVAGRLVKTLADGSFEAGRHEFVWSGGDDADRQVASGVYLYRLDTREGSEVRRMVLVE
jgi:FlgD Ig-like domain